MSLKLCILCLLPNKFALLKLFPWLFMNVFICSPSNLSLFLVTEVICFCNTYIIIFEKCIVKNLIAKWNILPGRSNGENSALASRGPGFSHREGLTHVASELGLEWQNNANVYLPHWNVCLAATDARWKTYASPLNLSSEDIVRANWCSVLKMERIV